MTYFSLRKRAPEPEPEPEPEAGAPADQAPAENQETEQEQAAKQHGPVLAGLLGPSQWITGHLGAGPAWGIHVVGVWAPCYYGGWAAVLVPAGWLLTVLLFVPREHLDRLSARIERGRAKPTPVGAPTEGGRDGILALLHSLIGDAHGVHLRTVLDHLQEHGQWEGREVADLRRHLEALGIPVRPKVKIGKTPTRGVLKADLDTLPPIEETAPSPTPSTAV